MYLLDTNAVSSMLRFPAGPVGGRVMQLDDDDIATSSIVMAEVRFGLAKHPSERLGRQLAIVLERLRVLPFEAGADEHYGRLRADLERRGLPIGANDLFIAAHALSLEATLVTDNVREFSRVEGLAVENWLRD